MVKNMLPFKTAYFENLEVGHEFETPGRTITEADIVTFAGLSGDHHPLHTDASFAAKGPYKRRIAHGMLSLSIVSGLVMQLGILERSILAFRELTCKFSKPVFIGDTIYARLEVASTKAMRRIGGGLVNFQMKVYNQHEQIVQSGTWSILLHSNKSVSESDRQRDNR